MNSSPEKTFSRPSLSVVIPMFNEAENARHTLTAVAEVLERSGLGDFELVPVNDGSTDGTDAILAEAAHADPRVRPAGYPVNVGRGRALKTGFAAARGELVAAIDADLSYSPDHVVRMARALTENPGVDIVLASAYMPGGRVESVPFSRLMISKLGNRLIRATLPGNIRTITCVVRAYRREVLERLDIESDGKEIHLEILAKALSLGYKVMEIPATLTSRKRGTSKSRVFPVVSSHLAFVFAERPFLLFGLMGFFAMLCSLLLGGYLVYLWQTAALNPNRPFMTLLVLLFLGGIQLLSFGLLAILIVSNRRELYRIERQNRELRLLLERRTEPDLPQSERLP